MNLRDAIQKRHTLKVLADPESPWDVSSGRVRDKVEDLLAVAINAPYHKPADKTHCDTELSSPVPWRFHALDASACRTLSARLAECDQPTGKIRNMLAAADALVMTTWLPNPDEQPEGFQAFSPTLQNMEHIAAASAATQNLLLLATEAGWNNYWSSGGVLRSEMVFEWAGIPLNQILLGAIFLFPSDTRGVDVKPGGLRDRKGAAEQWSRWVQLD
jgi:nitroreductase